MTYNLTIKGKIAFGEPIEMPGYLLIDISKAYGGIINAMHQLGPDGLAELLDANSEDMFSEGEE